MQYIWSLQPPEERTVRERNGENEYFVLFGSWDFLLVEVACKIAGGFCDS